MFRCTSRFGLPIALLVCCTFAQQSRAQQAAVSITGSSAGINSPEGGDYTHGFKFIPNVDISVSALGYYDFQGNGLANDCTVGIFDSGGTLLSSTTVASGTAAPLTDKFRYTNITPLLLSAGQTYTAAGRALGTEVLFAASSDLGVNPSLSLTGNPHSGVYNESAGFNFPMSIGNYQAYLGPNFRFAVVPAPSAVAAFVIGAVPGVIMLRRRRK